MLFLMLVLLTSMMNLVNSPSIHQFEIRALDSEEMISFDQFAGKKILIVNVASKCGYTRQYANLEALYEKYQDQLVVIGFPCNQFGGQEPGSEEQIAEFCSSTYGVTFPMTEKVMVKGENVHEIYRWLTSKDLNGVDDYKITWNFNKFLLDEQGQLLGHFASGVDPLDEAITKHLTR